MSLSDVFFSPICGSTENVFLTLKLIRHWDYGNFITTWSHHCVIPESCMLFTRAPNELRGCHSVTVWPSKYGAVCMRLLSFGSTCVVCRWPSLVCHLVSWPGAGQVGRVLWQWPWQNRLMVPSRQVAGTLLWWPARDSRPAVRPQRTSFQNLNLHWEKKKLYLYWRNLIIFLHSGNRHSDKIGCLRRWAHGCIVMEGLPS